MKIALAQLNYHIGYFEQNKAKITAAIEKAKKGGADLVVFAELAICGYPPRDFLEFSDFILRCDNAINEIAAHCVNIAAVVGAPAVNPKVEGKNLYNSAFFLANGKIQQTIHKTLLPTYDVFDEYRYFEPNRKFEVVHYKGNNIAITICEDLWDIGEDLMYTVWPMDELIKQEPDVIINIAASPFHYNQPSNRTAVLEANAREYHLPLVYVNHVGAQTELLFDGGSVVMDQEGNVRKQLASFEEDFYIVDTSKLHDYESVSMPVNNEIALIHDALVMGIKNYFKKLHFSKALLGLSGGIDSAVTLALAVEALGKENVFAVMLPSRFSSGHSVDDSVILAKHLQIKCEEISIEGAFSNMERLLAPWFANTPFDTTEENMQARLRAVILMAFSNKFGYILLNTSNKSEAAVGYGTLYGDMCGGLSVLGDVYKMQVYDLARYINRNREIIPEAIINKPPSAELRDNQMDQDSLPPYSVLDKILYAYIEQRKGPNEIIALGYDAALVNRVLKMVNTNEYKRHQTPPILRVSPKAFGMGRRMPIVAKYLL
ncbi:MAG: NAD+ synthase [Bacteroidales bacterium]|nr:NAD+ synthase [Bacteroidales bacterium]